MDPIEPVTNKTRRLAVFVALVVRRGIPVEQAFFFFEGSENAGDLSSVIDWNLAGFFSCVHRVRPIGFQPRKE
jgi:hypothetical protein